MAHPSKKQRSILKQLLELVQDCQDLVLSPKNLQRSGPGTQGQFQLCVRRH